MGFGTGMFVLSGNYFSIWHVVIMAVLFNILKLWISQANLLLYWVAPALLGTFQLFISAPICSIKAIMIIRIIPGRSRAIVWPHFFPAIFLGIIMSITIRRERLGDCYGRVRKQMEAVVAFGHHRFFPAFFSFVLFL